VRHDYLTKPFEKTEAGRGDAEVAAERSNWQRRIRRCANYCDQVTEDLSFLAASPQMVRIHGSRSCRLRR